jgi:hypothetical protein
METAWGRQREIGKERQPLRLSQHAVQPLTITTPEVDATQRSEPNDLADQLGHDTATAKKNLTGDAQVTE